MKYVPVGYELGIHIEVDEHLDHKMRLIEPCCNLLDDGHLKLGSRKKREGGGLNRKERGRGEKEKRKEEEKMEENYWNGRKNTVAKEWHKKRRQKKMSTLFGRWKLLALWRRKTLRGQRIPFEYEIASASIAHLLDWWPKERISSNKGQ